MAGAVDEGTVTMDDVVRAARRGAIALASDPEMRCYSPETLARVYQRTIENMAGAGDLGTIASRMATDPKLTDLPFEVVEPIVAASFRHFAHAMGSVR